MSASNSSTSSTAPRQKIASELESRLRNEMVRLSEATDEIVAATGQAFYI